MKKIQAFLDTANTVIAALYENFPNCNEVLWGYTQAHRQDWEMMKVALDKGATSIRVGFEDSDMIPPGIHCDTNAAIIADVVDIIKSKGMMPITPAEARAMLGHPQLKT